MFSQKNPVLLVTFATYCQTTVPASDA